MGCTSSSAAAPISRSTVEKATTKDQSGDRMTDAYSKYELGEKIGRGSYAQVHIAINRHTNVEVAVKVRNLHPEPAMKSQLDQDKVLKSCVNELSLWKAVGSHTNCVRLLDSFFDDHLAYMAMEKCDGSLFKYLHRQEAVYETCLGKAFEHMLTGISHMHSVSIIHRDLKPDNFLVQGSTVKICDFGLSAMMPRSGIVEGIVGTAPFMPPEMLATRVYDQTADVWSFGVVAYMFLCGEFPYKTSDGTSKMMKKSIVNGEEADCSRRWLTTNAVTFLQQVLKRKPCERPTAAVALQLPFITSPHSKPLPCLHRVLNLAHKTGAFDSKDLPTVTETDVLLTKLRNGELKPKSIRSFANVDVNDVCSTPLKDIKGMIRNDTSSPRSESTVCGSSSYNLASSTTSSDFRRKL